MAPYVFSSRLVAYNGNVCVLLCGVCLFVEGDGFFECKNGVVLCACVHTCVVHLVCDDPCVCLLVLVVCWLG